MDAPLSTGTARVAGRLDDRLRRAHRMLDFLAYIDPGSGSLIIQALIATVVAVPFFLRQQIARVVRGLRRGRSTDDRAS